MKSIKPAVSFKSITCKSLQALLYALAFYLSVQLPAQKLEQGQHGQFAFEKQNYCLVPIEEQNNRSVSNSIKLLPVVVLSMPEFLKGFSYREVTEENRSQVILSSVIYSTEEIIITMRRLRI